MPGHDTPLDIAQLAPSRNPTAGRNLIYPKADGKLYTRDSAGVETLVSLDTTAVHQTGNETVAGVKTFTDPFILDEETAAPAAPSAGSKIYSRAGRVWAKTPSAEYQLAIDNAAVNLIANGDMELAKAGTPPVEPLNWNGFWHNGSTTFSQDTTVAATGLASAKATLSATNTDNVVCQTDVFPLPGGGTLLLEFNAKSEVGAQILIEFQTSVDATNGAPNFFASGTYVTGAQAVVFTDTSWAHYSRALAIPAGHTLGRMCLRVGHASGDATARAVSIDTVTARIDPTAAQAPQWHKVECKVAMTTNVTISNPGTAIFDGQTLAQGDRLLLTGQTAGAENGIYLFQTSSSAMLRAGDADTPAELAGAQTAITLGTYGGTRWGTNFKATDIVGTTVMNWSQGGGWVFMSRKTYKALSGGLSMANSSTNNVIALQNASADIPAGASIVQVKTWLNARATVNQAVDYFLQVTLDGTTWIELDTAYLHNQGDQYQTLGAALMGWINLATATQLQVRVLANIAGGGGPVVVGYAEHTLNFFKGTGDYTPMGSDTLEFCNLAMSGNQTGVGQVSFNTLAAGGQQGMTNDGAGRMTVQKAGAYYVQVSLTGNSTAVGGGWIITSLQHLRSGSQIGLQQTVQQNGAASTAGFDVGVVQAVFNAQVGDQFAVLWSTSGNSQIDSRSIFSAYRLAGPGPKGDKGDAGGLIPVRAVAISNITLSGTQTVDGVALVAGDRVLAVSQTNPAQNGVYDVLAGTWVRSNSLDTSGELAIAIVAANEGTYYGGTQWVNDFKSTSTLETTAMDWWMVNDGNTSTDTEWATLAFAGGANNGTINYRRIANTVHFDIKNLGHSSNTLAAGTVLSAVIPAGFRPGTMQPIRLGQSGGVLRGLYIDTSTNEIKADFGFSGGGTFWGGFSYPAADAPAGSAVGTIPTPGCRVYLSANQTTASGWVTLTPYLTGYSNGNITPASTGITINVPGMYLVNAVTGWAAGSGTVGRHGAGVRRNGGSQIASTIDSIVSPGAAGLGTTTTAVVALSAGDVLDLQAYHDSATNQTVVSGIGSTYLEVTCLSANSSVPMGGSGSPLADTGWIALPFLNGWANYGSTWETGAYRRKDGIVYLRGLVKGGTVTSGTQFAGPLPAGFRPGSDSHIVVASNATYGQINIFADGRIQTNTPLSAVWVSLANISFPADN